MKEERTTDIKTDKLFLTEILNDLHRHGFVVGGKAYQMLHDWGRELREDTRRCMPASRLKKIFCREVGEENW